MKNKKNIQREFKQRRFKKIININWISSLFYEEFSKDFYFSGESHNDWEFVYADKGSIIATAETTDFYLKQGDIIFHKPNEFHRLRANGKDAPNVFIMCFDCKSPAMNHFNGKHIHLNTKERSLIGLLLDEASNTYVPSNKYDILMKEDPLVGGEQMISTYLEQLLIMLIRGEHEKSVLPSKDTFDDPLVQAICDILEEKLYEDLSLDDISAKLNYGKTYLCLKFKNATGSSIFQYYNQMKIQKAKELLRDSTMNVTQISERLAFCNPHYFTAAFKKHVNMTPREYQQSIKKYSGVRTKKTP